jgi:hypothetical protein
MAINRWAAYREGLASIQLEALRPFLVDREEIMSTKLDANLESKGRGRRVALKSVTVNEPAYDEPVPCRAQSRTGSQRRR